MGSIGSISNYGLGEQEYGSLNPQRKRSETEPEGSVLDNLMAAQQDALQEQQDAEQQTSSALARRDAPEIVCPQAQEVPEIMAGLVSGISQSPAWKLGEIQPAGKSRLVSPAYV
jgi:hypothetical protein